MALARMMVGTCCFASLCWIAGCSPSTEYKPAKDLPTPTAHEHHHHEHEHAAGPHGGSLVEIGEEEFHAELVLDEKTHTLTLYLLGADGKAEATTAAKEAVITAGDNATYTLNPVAGSMEGAASAFQLSDEKRIHELAEAGFIHGQLAITIGDKAYTAEVDVHFEGDHEHDHAHEKGAKTP